MRAVERLRQILASVGAVTVAPQVALSIHSDFENGTEFTPADLHKGKVKAVVDQVLAWNDAMRTLRRA